MPKTVVYKSTRNYGATNTGTVIPVAIEHDDGSIETVDPSKYPNNQKIFISKDFEKIENSYEERELFFLSTVHESNDFESEHLEDFSKSKYFSMGFYATALDTNTYLPVIEMDMPDIASGLGQLPHGSAFEVRKNFFILSNDVVSGPFRAQAEDDNLLIMPIDSLSPLDLSKNHIAQFKLSELENSGLVLRCSFGGYDKLFFTSLKKAKAEVKFEHKDYISDNDLIRYFAKFDFGSAIGNLTKNEVTKLANSIDAYFKKRNALNDNERYKRIKSVLGEYLASEGVGVNLVQEHLSTKQGKIFLENYVNSNRETILKDKISAIEVEFDSKLGALKENYDREKAKVDENRDLLKTDFEQFVLKIEREKSENQNTLNALIAQNKEQEKSTLRDRNNELMSEIEHKEKVLLELKSKVGGFENLHSMQTKQIQVEGVIDHLKGQQKKLEDENKRISDLISSQLSLLKKPSIATDIVEFKTIQMLLNGISPEISDSAIRPILLPKYSFQVTGETRKSYIQNLKKSLDHQASGRPYTYDETANLLLCTLQSYITILAGPPGTGKTSTATRFSEVLGLVAKEKNAAQTDNFLSISVGRGWVSTRDMLGFYNSMKNTYQPSRSGLYQFINAFSKFGVQDESEDYLKLVLMDEANLSSIEHYWSDFLLMCDNFEANQKIDLGVSSNSERFLHIPSSLRFIGTINNDATVESLSNRLIDRAAIISLGYGVDAGNPNEVQQEILAGAVPYNELMKAFNPEKDEEMLEERDLNQFKKILLQIKLKVLKFTLANVRIMQLYDIAQLQSYLILKKLTH